MMGLRSVRPIATRTLAAQFGARISLPPMEGEWYRKLYGSYECELSDPEDFLEEFLKENEDG